MAAGAFTERVRAAYGPDGRLPLPGLPDWDIFPFEGSLQVKHLADPVLPEPARHGEDESSCGCRDRADTEFLSDRRALAAGHDRRANCLPAYLLMPCRHCDLADLPDELAAELGVLVVRIDRLLPARMV